MFVTNCISTTKIQKISEITNFFRHYFLSRTEVISNKVLTKKFLTKKIITIFAFYNKEKRNDYDRKSI